MRYQSADKIIADEEQRKSRRREEDRVIAEELWRQQMMNRRPGPDGGNFLFGFAMGIIWTIILIAVSYTAWRLFL